VEFANDELKLTSKSEEFAGKKYSTLDEEVQQKFLSYAITVEQLLNASDDDVIDIFARLNSYTVALNAAEKRHALYQTSFKFAVRKASQDFRGFIEKYKVFSLRKRFRMADDTFMAETIGVLLDGVKDGGDRYLKILYRKLDDDAFTDDTRTVIAGKLRKVFTYLDAELGRAISGPPLNRHYHLLMLIAAYAHHVFGIPRGDLATLPPRSKKLASGSEVGGYAASGRSRAVRYLPKPCNSCFARRLGLSLPSDRHSICCWGSTHGFWPSSCANSPPAVGMAS
jgi:hypothetical protein